MRDSSVTWQLCLAGIQGRRRLAVSSEAFSRSAIRSARWRGGRSESESWSWPPAPSAGAVQPEPFFRAYLAAYVFYLGIALGSMVLLMVYHLTGGSWGLLIRRILEAACGRCRWLALLFLPIAWGCVISTFGRSRTRWPPARSCNTSSSTSHPTYFWIRAAVYFLLWTAIAWLLARWSRQEDETGQPAAGVEVACNSAPSGRLFTGSVCTSPRSIGRCRSSPLFIRRSGGRLFAAGQLLSALAFALVVLAWLVDRPPLAEVISPKARNDLGSLLLTLLILWAYMAWFQFMLIWIANMPVDIIWYFPARARLAGGDVGDRPAALRGALLPLADAAHQAEQHGRVACDRRPDPPDAVAVLYYQVIPGFAAPPD